MSNPGLDAATPLLVVDLSLFTANTDAVLARAGNPSRLWPHIKSAKSSRFVMMLQARGVRSFKCATLAEARILGRCGAKDALLAYPATGPVVEGLAALAGRHRATRFGCLVEDAARLATVSRTAEHAGVDIDVFVDVDAGQDRSGIASPELVSELFDRIGRSECVRAAGLHLYDGHNHQSDIAKRTAGAERCVKLIDSILDRLGVGGHDPGVLIMGGTPTFPIYAREARFSLSPGTAFYYDAGYRERFPDLPFVPAAWVLGRVVSVRGPCALTIDIGTKAIATDPSGSRGTFVDMAQPEVVLHNEEHWTLRFPAPHRRKAGDTVRVVPSHICPTVNLYNAVCAVDPSSGEVEWWPVDARDRVVSPSASPSP